MELLPITHNNILITKSNIITSNATMHTGNITNQHIAITENNITWLHTLITNSNMHITHKHNYGLSVRRSTEILRLLIQSPKNQKNLEKFFQGFQKPRGLMDNLAVFEGMGVKILGKSKIFPDKMPKYDIQTGDKIVKISSNSTYEKVEKIEIINGIAVIHTKEYHINTNSLVNNSKIQWKYEQIEKRLDSENWPTYIK